MRLKQFAGRKMLSLLLVEEIQFSYLLSKGIVTRFMADLIEDWRAEHKY